MWQLFSRFRRFNSAQSTRVNQRYILLFFGLFIHFFGASQIMIHPNRGQWDSRVAYKVELEMGEMLIENQGVTYNFYQWHHPHHCDHHKHCSADPNIIKNHVVKTKFLNSSVPSTTIERDTFQHYRNYYLGNDESKWKSGIHAVRQVVQKNIYPNIDIEYQSSENGLKYSFVVAPSTSPDLIRIEFTGADMLQIDKQGRLIVTTSLGEIIESKPIAWTVDTQGKRSNVKAKFRLEGNIVSFDLGSYNNNEQLIIDPELAFSTFTGATSDNWGFTACPDADGNLYAGGIVFGPGYPVTPGAFDTSFNGGNASGIAGFDVSITKFNATGTANLYSTFLGGAGNEVPTSIVTNTNGELFVLSITSSSNFPTTANVFQSGFAGGPAMTAILFFNGSDIAISRFNSTGTALLASTYVGGSNNDGLNEGSNLNFNYGDVFRGEIIVDNQGSVYFASTTKSTNFPMASTLSSLSGAQDAVYGKLPENLGTLLFCRYYGGGGFETGNSIQQAPNGDLYMTGGTTSNNINQGQGGVNSSYFGATDAYVIRISSLTGVVQNGTYLGTNQYDQGYFVQTDLDNNVYVFGQARGNYPMSGGVYGNANSGQFIHKLGPNLTNTLWSTRIGSGSGNIEISPTAFLVSNCYDIYIAGWGGATNQSNSLATQSSTIGFPTTPGSHQQNTNGSNFYLAVLAQDAAYLKYGTFMGGISSSANHVDGGTSRFSKEGTIFHAVCGSCGANNNGFTTTPGVWSPSAMSSNCNLAAFKFNLSTMEAAIGNTDPVICIPNPVTFINNSANGNQFIWDFGDGNGSTAENPSHNYTVPGNYVVTLVVIDTNACFYNDTVFFEVFIGQFQGAVTAIAEPVCPGESVQLSASGGVNYQWSPPQFLDNPNIANPIATVQVPTLFSVIVSDTCGSDTLTVFVNVYDDILIIEGPDVICLDDEAVFSSNLPGLQNIQWTPSAIFPDPNVSPVTISPIESVTIGLSGTSVNGCVVNAQSFLQVDITLPIIELVDELQICRGNSEQVTVSGGNSYLWNNLPGIFPLDSPTVTVNPTESSWYYVTAFNACGSSEDSLFVEVIIPEISAWGDTTVCPGEVALVYASGGVYYTWEPAEFVVVSVDVGQSAIVRPPVSTIFTATGTDQYGCIDTAQVLVSLFPMPFVQTSPDVYAFLGDPIQISAITNNAGTFSWTPVNFLSCPFCQTTSVNTTQNMTYTVYFVDQNGCSAQDDINISFDAVIYVPNTFTPDGNLFNPVFKPEGGNITEFHMIIFNRWGEIMFESYNFNIGWDGTYGGQVCQDGTYIWVIEYKDINNKKDRLIGHINLLK